MATVNPADLAQLCQALGLPVSPPHREPSDQEYDPADPYYRSEKLVLPELRPSMILDNFFAWVKVTVLPSCSGLRIWDFGCGRGPDARLYQQHVPSLGRYLGWDAKKELIDQYVEVPSRKRRRQVATIDLVVQNLHRPWNLSPKDRFDVACFHFMMELLQGQREDLTRWWPVLDEHLSQNQGQVVMIHLDRVALQRFLADPRQWEAYGIRWQPGKCLITPFWCLHASADLWETWSQGYAPRHQYFGWQTDTHKKPQRYGVWDEAAWHQAGEARGFRHVSTTNLHTFYQQHVRTQVSTFQALVRDAPPAAEWYTLGFFAVTVYERR